MDVSDRTVEVCGLRTRYLAAGSGPPVVLLHGGGESAGSWQGVMPGLAKRFRVLAPDLPGSGGSARPRAPFSRDVFGKFVAGFLNALNVPHAALVGHSLGGLAALQFALVAPNRVSALGLVASAGFGREISPVLSVLTLPVFGDWATAWALTPLGQIQRLGLRALGCFARPALAPAAWFAEQFRLGLDPALVWNQLLLARVLIDQAGQREVLLDRLPELQVPTLIVWGDCDEIIPVAHARAAVRRIPGSRLAVIPDCGHMPQVERPALFLGTLTVFLGEIIGRTPVEGRHETSTCT